MTTSGNKDWAYKEATRRAAALNRPYAIYRQSMYDDYIIRPAHHAAPDAVRWQNEAVIEIDGKVIEPRLFYSASL
jgi:hypothetical protein